MSVSQFYAPARLVGCLVYDINTLSFVEMTQPGGGSGGAVTVADGADVAQGATADAAWSGSGAGTIVAILKKMATSGTGGGPATVADGADVAEGATTDLAVTSDANGTLSAKLRGLVKIFASVWDSGNGRLKVDGSAVTQPVSGTFWQGTQPVSGPLTDTQLRASAVPVTSSPAGAATAALSNVNASATSVTVLAANSARLGFALYNDSSSAVDVKCGSAASATSFVKRLLANEYFATKDLGVNYTGIITAIWDSATGAMRVTEFTT